MRFQTSTSYHGLHHAKISPMQDFAKEQRKASGFEEIVTYNNKGEYLEISVTELNAMPSDAIREVFNIDNNG